VTLQDCARFANFSKAAIREAARFNEFFHGLSTEDEP
jgi:hypothetical protein